MADLPHQARDVAESFGVDPARYDRARPPYPDGLVAAIVGVSPGPDILDVGCGTGIEGRQLRALGGRVLGVDPDGRMAELARRSGLDVEVATFEGWEPAGRRFDAVVAGQSWHWVDPVAGPAKAAAVLRPGGVIAVLGHVFDPPTPVADAQAEGLRRVAPDGPLTPGPGTGERSPLGLYQAMFARFAEQLGATPGFGSLQTWRVDWERPYTRDEWLDLVPTTGALTGLAPGPLAEVLAGVGAAIDGLGGGFTMRYSTLAVVATRTAG